MKLEAKNILLKADVKVDTAKTFLIPGQYGSAQQYRIVLSNPNTYYAFNFTDSIFNTTNNKPLSLDDVIYCILSDMHCYEDSIDINDFAAQFGFEKISKCLKAYNGCKEASEKLHQLFTDEQLEKLQTIYQDY